VPNLSVFLAAEEAAGTRALRVLGGAGHRVAGVLTADRRRGGAAGVAAAALHARVPVVATQDVDDAMLAEFLR
jgi:hypothetical protein